MSRFRCLGRTEVSVLVGGTCSYFVKKKACFYGEDFQAPHPIPKLDDHSLSAVRDCLFNIYTTTPHTGSLSSIRILRTCHAVVTETHLSQFICLYIYHNFLGCLVDWTGLELLSDELYQTFEFHVRTCLQNDCKNCILVFLHLSVCLPSCK